MLIYFFFTYIVGPVASLLPARWRNALPFSGHVQWARAAALSGVLQIAAAILALANWDQYTMYPIVDRGVDLALSGKLGGGITDQQIAGAAYTVFLFHPLTWVLVYFSIEGAVRLCGAAFAENVLGTLPLGLIDRMLSLATIRTGAKPGLAVERNAQSFSGAVRERTMLAHLKQVPDELHYATDQSQELLEIRASRRKEDWLAPKVVRVDELYYRLEENSVESGPRPFRYRLRRLERGVPGRNVLLYKTADAVVKQ
jgi:hypothetical protein